MNGSNINFVSSTNFCFNNNINFILAIRIMCGTQCVINSSKTNISKISFCTARNNTRDIIHVDEETGGGRKKKC